MLGTRPIIMVDIVLQGPGKNALSTGVMRAALAALDAAGDAPVLLTGHGDAFSAGLNLKEVATLDGEGMLRFLETLDALVVRLFTHPAPVVALLNGHAIAGGCILALCADHRVSVDAPSVRIGLNETALGLVFPPRVMKLARARLPRHTLDTVLLDAGLYAPAEALRLGLVDAVSADAEGAARAALSRLASHPAEAYRGNKKLLREGVLDLDDVEARAFRDELIPRWLSRRDAMAALLPGRRAE